MSTIAVVDDSKATLRWIEGVLGAATHRVVSFDDPDGLEDRIERLAPQLLLLDIVMPGRSGYDVLRKLRKRRSTASIPVVLVSSKKEPTDIAWGLRQGAVGYLPKPFTEAELISAVDAALAGGSSGGGHAR